MDGEPLQLYSDNLHFNLYSDITGLNLDTLKGLDTEISIIQEKDQTKMTDQPIACSTKKTQRDCTSSANNCKWNSTDRKCS